MALNVVHPGRASAADAALGAEAAEKLPIADAHFHVMPWMDLQELLQRMERNNIRWAGGAAALGGPARNQEAAQAIGKRYIRPTGQGQWIGLKQAAGVAALENAEFPGFKQALAAIDRDLENPQVRVIGEIHVNTNDTAANPVVHHKIRADAPTLKAILELAGKHKKPLNIHAQWDRDTAGQVEALAGSSPNARLILSHCGSTASASDIRGVFERHPNVSCDLSFRSPPQLKQLRTGYSIFERSGIRGEWRRLIEDYPERFIVGLDDQENWSAYEETVKNIRAMLADLSPAAAERVAYKNAQELLGLE